ncbi:hypothetical protein WMY93_006206 [Mugilogobius chulae]|uniref:Uncharacterized protein n=1 Tax=Mugilogobius chulae TaxID=88201 RepID=A0AAW0PLT8_9GOBI
MSFLRRVAGRSLRDRVRSSVTREELGVEPLLLHIERGQLRWLGHLYRMPPGRLPVPAIASKKATEKIEKLQTELEDLIPKILKGLEEIQAFLEAVEKLAVTSEPVFDLNPVLQLGHQTDLESVRRILLAARIVCPHLLLFKRDDEEFFKAKLHNVEVMKNQMNQYIRLIKNFYVSLIRPTLVIKPDVSEDDVEKVLSNVNMLHQIRNDIHFRMVFLFGDECKTFMEKFSEKKERMHKFLNDLEPCAVQLDSMNKGARISNVVSSSLGLVGGGLSIAGLALTPLTAGASLGLTIAGAAVAGANAVSSVATTLTDKVVSSKQRNKANETLKNFMEDVNDLQNCLREDITQHFNTLENCDIQTASVPKKDESISDCVDLLKSLKDEKGAVKTAGSGQAIGQAASGLPELGGAALRGPLAISKAARGGFIALNALSIGVDIFMIANESIKLSRGSETETSKWIRARADLWRGKLPILKHYVKGTFIYIHIVIDFTSKSSDWIKDRENESEKMKVDEENPESSYKDETELQEGLQPTLKALKEMQHFLEAVEMLAVTSVHVFDLEKKQKMWMSQNTDLESVMKIISSAQLICPLLIAFKRDNEVFFSPKLENLEVMHYQLKQYITNIKHICDVFRQACPKVLCLDFFSVELKHTEDDKIQKMQKMLCRISELYEIREDKHFRTAFLFQDKYQIFMKEFKERKDRMQQFLKDLETCAAQLNSVQKNAHISNVLGSSVGLVGGVMSIVGLAMIPMTAGASVGLIGAGAGLGALSGASAAVTTVAEIGVNRTHMKTTNDTIKSFMEDLTTLQKCLDDVIKQHFENMQENLNYQYLTKGSDAACLVKAGFLSFLIDMADMGEATAKGAMAMGKVVRRGFIALNALSVGLDVYTIVDSSIDLYKGTETKASKWIKARAPVWKSEVESMQKISDSLEKGQSKQILQMPFY